MQRSPDHNPTPVSPARRVALLLLWLAVLSFAGLSALSSLPHEHPEDGYAWDCSVCHLPAAKGLHPSTAGPALPGFRVASWQLVPPLQAVAAYTPARLLPPLRGPPTLSHA